MAYPCDICKTQLYHISQTNPILVGHEWYHVCHVCFQSLEYVSVIHQALTAKGTTNENS